MKCKNEFINESNESSESNESNESNDESSDVYATNGTNGPAKKYGRTNGKKKKRRRKEEEESKKKGIIVKFRDNLKPEVTTYIHCFFHYIIHFDSPQI